MDLVSCMYVLCVLIQEGQLTVPANLMSAAVPHDEEGTSGQVDWRPSGYHRKSAAAVGIQIGIAVG
jgi:hypothetical protein